MRGRRDLVSACLVVAVSAALARLVGAGVVHHLGFSVVSDDDFARVVIAQRFAAAPHLDPSGTSWLPFPFWIVGGAMRWLGPSLHTARTLSLVGAALAGAAVAVVARLVGLRTSRVVAASSLAAAMPWAMQLAVATVPEVPAAAFAASGALTLASASPAVRIVGALGLTMSTLSRYDAWPIAVAFAAMSLVDARRAVGSARAMLVAAASIALLGPVGWTAWEWHRYGDPFRYLGLVRSYRQALGQGPSIAMRVLGYPLGVVEEMREVLGAGVVACSAAWAVRHRSEEAGTRTLDVAWSRPLAMALLQLVVLIAGDVRDGAPTHHPERALLGPATIVVFASADAVGAWLAGIANGALRLFASLACVAALVGWIGVRLHRTMWWYEGAPRPREVAGGLALAEQVPRGDRVLLDTRDLPNGAIDYGYHAILAAFARPLDVDVDRDQDPRRPHARSSFDDAVALRARLAADRAQFVLVWGSERAAVARSVGAVSIACEAPSSAGARVAGDWCILRVP